MSLVLSLAMEQVRRNQQNSLSSSENYSSVESSDILLQKKYEGLARMEFWDLDDTTQKEVITFLLNHRKATSAGEVTLSLGFHEMGKKPLVCTISYGDDGCLLKVENEDKIKRSTSTVWVRPEGIEHEAFISDSLFAGDGVHRVEIERMASNINGEIKDDCLITSTGDYPIDLTSRFSGDFESKHKCFVEKDVQLDSPRVSLEDILHQGFPDMDGYSGFSSCESSNYRQLFSEHEANIERAKALYTMLPTNKKTSSIVR